jgi:transposase
VFDGLDDWLRERFFRHDGNADVVRQELESEHGIRICLRSVEKRVQGWRRELKAAKRATVRFETRPGQQLQIDFGETRVWIGEEQIRVHLFVATLGYSRRMLVRPSLRERQTDWFEGMEVSFLRFGGVPEEVLFECAGFTPGEADQLRRAMATFKHNCQRPLEFPHFRGVRPCGWTDHAVGFDHARALISSYRSGLRYPSAECRRFAL